mmetsp:Transcript_2910/g.7994  ORF Transcript_2910/g.7994 Transcript_2910/m.7994 type:complete len:385 (-) Transcript_2910:97-1251(-)
MIESVPIFRFRRYREELALRSSRRNCREGTEEEGNFHTPKIVEHDSRKNDAVTGRTGLTTADNDSCDDNGGNVIQNLCSFIILVDLHGNVLTEKKKSGIKIMKTNDESDDGIGTNNDEGGNSNGQKAVFVVQKRSTLLLRNLRDCHVIIHLPLPAVHFVGIENTEILFYNKRNNDSEVDESKTTKDSAIAPVSVNEMESNANANTTIHMTDCHGKSSLQLETSPQQLRIHRSIGLRVEMMKLEKNHRPVTLSANKIPSCDWKPGTIILEDSKAIVFCVPPLTETTGFNQSQERQLPVSSSTVTANTKKFWYQVVVKDFQWLRKGIMSPNFQVEVLTASHEEKIQKCCTQDFSSTLESKRNVSLLRSPGTKESEYVESSDSEDEL